MESVPWASEAWALEIEVRCAAKADWVAAGVSEMSPAPRSGAVPEHPADGR